MDLGWINWDLGLDLVGTRLDMGWDRMAMAMMRCYAMLCYAFCCNAMVMVGLFGWDGVGWRW